MKTLQNYKIETNGLNEAILHKAVEKGYEDKIDSPIRRNSKYLYLYSDGDITSGDRIEYFNDHENTEISAHDFLRLNWTPKVGEEVECVDGVDDIETGNRYTIEGIVDWSVSPYGFYLKEYPQAGNIFKSTRFIPVLPRKKQLRYKTEQEFESEFGGAWRVDTKWNLLGRMDYLFGQRFDGNYTPSNTNPEATNRFWQINDSMLTDKPLPEEKRITHDQSNLVTGDIADLSWLNKKPDEKPDAYISWYGPRTKERKTFPMIWFRAGEMWMCDSPENAYKYNILSESDYKAKYDKLMFEGYDVIPNRLSTGIINEVNVGCETVSITLIKHFYRLGKKLKLHSVDFETAWKYIDDNKKELGL